MGNNINELEERSVKQMVLKDDLKRLLIYWQLMKTALECIRTSDTIKEWAAIAKADKNKSFVDFRVLAADQQRTLDGMILKMKRTMSSDTWNAVMSTLTGNQVKEIDMLLNEITELSENAIEAITNNVKQAKVNAGIPLNDPTEDITEMKEMDQIIWSCIQPAEKRANPGDSDGYNEAEVYASLKILYKKLKREEDEDNQVSV